MTGPVSGNAGRENHSIALACYNAQGSASIAVRPVDCWDHFGRYAPYRCIITGQITGVAVGKHCSFALAGCSLSGVLIRFLGLIGLDGVAPVLMTAWFLGAVVTSFRVSGFHCPRCGRRFFEASWYYNSFARRCVHCGLPKWEDGLTAKDRAFLEGWKKGD